MILNLDTNKLAWHKGNGLLPVIVQHQTSGQVLMLGYMNSQALQATIDTQKVTFYSRSKQRLWVKGETSANYLSVHSISCDCDADTLLILATPAGPTCHTGTASCFGSDSHEHWFLYQLEQIIRQRKTQPPTQSYVASLFAQGTKRMAQKVGEEGVETALAAATNDLDELTNESADLLFHLLVLLQNHNLSMADILACLQDRHQKRSAQ